MAKPEPNPKSASNDPALREQVVQRLLRDGVPPEKLAAELKVRVELIQQWKDDYLRQLRTASKPAPVRTEKPATGLVGDLNRQHSHSHTPLPKPRPLQPEVVAFPAALDPRSILSPDERKGLEHTQRLILEKGTISGEASRKLGMLPKQMYEIPKTPGQYGQKETEADAVPFAFNHGISAQSRASFAKNWNLAGTGEPVHPNVHPAAKMGPGLVPPPPPGVQLSKVEQFSTRLQDLPVLGWLLRGGKTDAAPWLILGMIALVATSAAVLLSRYSKPAPPPPASSLASSRTYTTGEVEARNALARKFFEAKTIDEMLPLIRHAETVRPVMERHYRINPLRSRQVNSVEYLERTTLHDKSYTVHGVWLAGRNSEWRVYIEDTAAGPKLDWETAADYRPMSWTNFQRYKIPEPTNFRVQARLSTYYDQPFKDGKVWRSFRLEHPEETKQFYGFAMIGSEIERWLTKKMVDEEEMAEIILTIKRPPRAKRDNVVQILEPIIHPTWVVDYKPGQRHFDLPSEEAKPAEPVAPAEPVEAAPLPPPIEEPTPAPATPELPPVSTQPDGSPSGVEAAAAAAATLAPAALAPKPAEPEPPPLAKVEPKPAPVAKPKPAATKPAASRSTTKPKSSSSSKPRSTSAKPKAKTPVRSTAKPAAKKSA